MTNQEIRDAIAADAALQAMQSAGNYAGIAAALPAQTVVVEYFITERGVRSLDVAPVSRKALLDTIKAAQTETPAWAGAVMDGAGISAADQVVYLDDLASAWPWLVREGGVNVGASGARLMLDLIAAGVPDAAEACAAVKALAEVPDVVSVHQVSRAIIEGAE